MKTQSSFAKQLELAPAGDDRLRFLGEAGYLWMYLGQLAKAAQIFEGLTLLAPADPVGYMGLAEVALRAGKWKETEKQIERALRSAHIDRSTTGYAYILRGQVSLARGRFAEAKRHWQRAARVEPQSSPARMAQQWLEALEAGSTPESTTNGAATSKGQGAACKA